MQQRFVKYGQTLFIGSFAVAVAFGTLALMVPGIYQGEEEFRWYDCLFTATSSVCVTGLTVVPVEKFSFAGQFILLVLLQIGGIGIMTLSSALLLLLGGGLSFSDSLLVSNLNDKFSLRGASALIRISILYSFISEGIGVLLILPGVILSGGYPWWRMLWNAFFLSVSSFCNAGLAPLPNSLEGQHALTKIGCCFLIVLGGLGIYVIYDIMEFLRKRRRSLQVHTKVVLFSTTVLLAGGAVLLWSFGSLYGQSLDPLDALFTSATCRTAGFTCIEVASLPAASLALIVILMMIGGAPGSTAGGIKTSTIAVAAAAIWNTLKGNQETLLFRRRIPNVIVLRAFTIIVLFSLLACLGAVVLPLLSSKPTISENVFEVVSALCTVGMSIGKTTANQSMWGKLLLTAFMFIGRIGPLTFLLFLLDRERPSQLQHPEERVIVG